MSFRRHILMPVTVIAVLAVLLILNSILFAIAYFTLKLYYGGVAANSYAILVFLPWLWVGRLIKFIKGKFK